MDIRRTCQFLLDKEKGRPDAKLRYRIKWDHNRCIVAFNVGYRVDIDKWSLDTQRCKNNTTHGRKKVMASRINREIQRYEAIVEEVFTDFERQDHLPAPDEVRDAVNRKLGHFSMPEKSPVEIFDDFVREMGSLNTWSEGTLKKMKTFRRRLNGFPVHNLTGFNEDGLHAFVAYLRDTEGLRESTCAKQLGILKWFLRWAVRKGIDVPQGFESFSPKFKKTENQVIFLDWDELMKVYHFTPPKGREALARVRDVFCFCCFTSLRYSDVASLTRDMIHHGCIHVTTVKTHDSITIELNRYSSEILSRYEGVKLPGGLALPVISNQKMNSMLKELCRMCGIDTPVRSTYYKGATRHDITVPKYELISTHCGRRTFICNALSMGIPPQVVMKWTGHSDYKAMKPYIEISEKTKSEAMMLFDRRSPESEGRD